MQISPLHQKCSKINLTHSSFLHALLISLTGESAGEKRRALIFWFAPCWFLEKRLVSSSNINTSQILSIFNLSMSSNSVVSLVVYGVVAAFGVGAFLKIPNYEYFLQVTINVLVLISFVRGKLASSQVSLSLILKVEKQNLSIRPSTFSPCKLSSLTLSLSQFIFSTGSQKL